MPFSDVKQSSVESLPSRVRTVIIGGGIHGVGVAHDLASRGWTDTLLLEKGEIGSETSAASTKLIHGGLRYLKRITLIPMVFKSLEERRLLQKLVPDLVNPVEFIYPILKKGGMPGFMIRFGLFLYDLLAGSKSIGKAKKVSEKEVRSRAGCVNVNKFSGFYSFWDCQTDDVGLVVRVASSAVNLGAHIAEGVSVDKIERDDNGWKLVVKDRKGLERTVSCLYVINCAGPWSNILLEKSGIEPKVKGINNRGSHLIVGDMGLKTGLFFESPKDKRIFFVLPWLGKTLIGTTEDRYDGNPDSQIPTDEDVDYMLDNINSYLSSPLSKDQIQQKFCGLRWLALDEKQNISSTSREVVFGFHDSDRGFMLTVYGGKLTSYRSLALTVGDEVTKHFGEFKKSRTHLAEYWVGASKEVKPIPTLESRFIRYDN